MKPEETNRLLIRRFPALADEYLSVKRLWGGEEPGPHIVYGDVFVPFIRTALAEDSVERLRSIAEFLEELSAIADSAILDVVVTTVLESLLDDLNRMRLERAMGPRTQLLWKRLAADTA